ncbi:MAG: EutN/CcmL family microcompartment protein [Clostridiaceae bacterium]|jgi:ethanolamine utilization protein EutN|nr:EutN/CcmL family microcompartment protein [Clostridiaceae bacterium]
MHLARIIGSVVATDKDERLTGVKLLVIQPIRSNGEDKGSPLVAVDTIGAGYGETVFYARSKEGAMPLEIPDVPVDAGVIGIVDSIHVPQASKERTA